ncbi:MAG: transporter, family, inner rane transport protein [Kribbellaceae bacterium]|nr:transporter, family, inner rane transport protein [Kribbellaceae bacterium]
MAVPVNAPALSPRRAAAALTILAVATFSFVTTEVLPMGLLTVMADDLDQSRSQVGQLVTGYAVVVVLASIPLARLTQRLPRRLVLTGTLGVFGTATLLSALAPTYPILFGARLVIALTQALFWSVVAPAAVGLFRPEVRGRVVARLAVGTALAPVLGIPLGTWLGQQAGWRTPFVVMGAMGFVASAGIAVLLPTIAPADSSSARGSAPDKRRYLLLMIATAIAVTGLLAVNTYVAPFLLDVGGFSPAALGPVLLATGLGGLTGTLLIGTLLDRHPWAAVVWPLGLAACALLSLFALGQFRPMAIALLTATGLAFSAFAVAGQNRTLEVAPGSTDIALAGSGSAFNIGIAGGALIGGILIDNTGVRSVALAGGLLTAIGFAVMLAEPRLVRGHALPADEVAQPLIAPARSAIEAALPAIGSPAAAGEAALPPLGVVLPATELVEPHPPRCLTQ